MMNEALFQHYYLEEIGERLSSGLGIKVFQSLANPGAEIKTGHDGVLFTDPLAVAPDGSILDPSRVIALLQFKDGQYTVHGREFEIPATGQESQYVRLLEQATQIPNVYYILNLIDSPPVLHAAKGDLIHAALAFRVEAISLFAGPKADYHILYDPSRSACFLRCVGAPAILAPLAKPFIGEQFVNEILQRIGRKGSWRAAMMLDKIRAWDSINSMEMMSRILNNLVEQGFEFRHGKTSLIVPAGFKPSTPLENVPPVFPNIAAPGLAKLLTEPTVRLVRNPDGSQFIIRRKGFYIPRNPRRLSGVRFNTRRTKRLVCTDSETSTEQSDREPCGDTPSIPWSDATGQAPEQFLPSTPCPEGDKFTPLLPEKPLSWGELKSNLNSSLNVLIRENVGKDPKIVGYSTLIKMGVNLNWTEILGWKK